MVSAQTMIDNRLAAIRLGCDSDEETQMEMSFFRQELAGVIGALLRSCRPSDFTTFLQLLVVGYSLAKASPAPVEPALTAAPTSAPPAERSHALTAGQLAGAEIRVKRMARRMTQRELGLRIGLSNSTISRWELGRYEPTQVEQQKLHAILAGGSVAQLPLKGYQ